MARRRFSIPRDIHYGWGVLEASLRSIVTKHALIVSDRGVEGLGLVSRIRELIGAAGAKVSVFNEVEANPSRTTCYRGQRSRLTSSPTLS